MKIENVETRIATGKLEYRAEGEMPVIAGYAAVFNSLSVDLWGFFEEIMPGAFTTTLETGPDVRATIDHAGGLTTIGRTRNGTLALMEDAVGLRVEIRPPATQAGRDVVELVRRGDVNQMSFMFRVKREEWRKLEDGMVIRQLHEIDLEDGDVSIVSYPAYPATSAEVRAKFEAMNQADMARSTPGATGGLVALRLKRLRLNLYEV